jgi:hypothetical protein
MRPTGCFPHGENWAAYNDWTYKVGVAGWIEGMTSEAIAAWVQAIGSILAIIAAFLIAHFEGRRAREREEARAAREDAERLTRAQGLALMLQPELAAFEGILERLGLSDRAAPPRTILDHADQLHVLGKAGGLILFMIGALNAHEQLRPPPAASAEGRAQLDRLRAERLRIAHQCCSDAVRELKSIIDAAAKPDASGA